MSIRPRPAASPKRCHYNHLHRLATKAGEISRLALFALIWGAGCSNSTDNGEVEEGRIHAMKPIPTKSSSPVDWMGVELIENGGFEDSGAGNHDISPWVVEGGEYLSLSGSGDGRGNRIAIPAGHQEVSQVITNLDYHVEGSMAAARIEARFPEGDGSGRLELRVEADGTTETIGRAQSESTTEWQTLELRAALPSRVNIKSITFAVVTSGESPVVLDEASLTLQKTP